jgi:hypothetical protein
MNQFKRKSSIKELQDRRFKTYTKEVKREEEPFQSDDNIKSMCVHIPMSAHIHVDGLGWLKDEKIKLFARVCGSKYNISFNFVQDNAWVGEDLSISSFVPINTTSYSGFKKRVEPKESYIFIYQKCIFTLLHEIGHSVDSFRRERFELKSLWSREVYASRWAMRWVNRLLPEKYEEALEDLAEALWAYHNYIPDWMLPKNREVVPMSFCKNLLDVRKRMLTA